MQDYLKNYHVTITALAPIYIGSGRQIGKKEYLYKRNEHRVFIPSIEKLYADIHDKGLSGDFQQYMTDYRKSAPYLDTWLRQHGYSDADYIRWEQYSLETGDAFENERPKEIQAFVKDAYGKPYIPGSSIKGMLRTALIVWEIQKYPEKYKNLVQDIKKNSGVRANRKKCLARETMALEQKVMNTLGRDVKSPRSAVNDKMAGVHVGDSVPLDTTDLTLCQKIDVKINGQEKRLPILRESIAPNTEIYFDISIDTTLDTYSMDEIIEAINCYQDICYRWFYTKFHRGCKNENIVWLGGGCGFAAKTIIYGILENDAVRVIDGIYRNTLGKNYREHKHDCDIKLGVAPHVCKCTRYHGELYDMGMARLEYVEA